MVSVTRLSSYELSVLLSDTIVGAWFGDVGMASS